MPPFGGKGGCSIQKVPELVRLVLSSNKEMDHVFSLLDFSNRMFVLRCLEMCLGLRVIKRLDLKVALEQIQ